MSQRIMIRSQLAQSLQLASGEHQEDTPSFTDEVGEENNQENITDSVVTASSEIDDTSDIPQLVTSETETERNPTALEEKLPKRKYSFEYKIKLTDEQRKATVISRALKSTGKNKFWLNVKDKEDGSRKA